MSKSLEDKLRQLVAYPSVTGDTAANRELLNYVAEFVAARGMHVTWFEFGGYESLVATTKRNHKTPKVLLAAHADVVPAAPQLFKLRKGNGYYHGRGVLDMKFALASYLEIIDTLRDNLRQYDIGLMVTTDEEVGGWHGTRELIAHGYTPQVCIIPDGGLNWQVQTFAKGIINLNIQASGISTHGSRPWEGDNAISHLLMAYAEIRALFPDRQTAEHNTCSMTRINAGKALTQIPNKATMTVDIRSISSTEHQRLLTAVEAICTKYHLKIQDSVLSPPTEFDLQNPLIAPYVQLVESIVGVKVVGGRTYGQNDGRFYAQVGIPCISLYPADGSHHTDTECMPIPALRQFFEITLRYIQQIAID